MLFVKDFIGDSRHVEKPTLDPHGHGRNIEVTFRDGEKIVGKTEGYNPQKPGFLVIPGDPDSNNIRIFVVTKNAQQVRFV